jgi:hypothetical protein
MPFVKGNTIGQDTRFKTGQSGNPAGRPPDKLRRHIYAELDKIEREAAAELHRLLGIERPPEADASVNSARRFLVARANPIDPLPSRLANLGLVLPLPPRTFRCIRPRRFDRRSGPA